MDTIDLQKIIDKFDLEKSGVAELLFPKNKCKYHAIRRIIQGEGELSASQMKKLADAIHVAVDDLYDMDNTAIRITDNGIEAIRGKESVIIISPDERDKGCVKVLYLNRSYENVSTQLYSCEINKFDKKSIESLFDGVLSEEERQNENRESDGKEV